MHLLAKNRIVCLFSIIFIAVAASCGKTLTPISADVLKYFSYQPGTYWIYRDSLTGVEDSFYVSKTSLTANANNRNYNEEISLIICVENDTFDCMWQLYENYVLYTFEYPSTSIGAVNTWVFNFQYPYVDNNTIYTYYPSYTLYGNVYDSVFEAGSNSSFGMVSTNAGMIKMHISYYSPGDTETHIWELTRYHIVH